MVSKIKKTNSTNPSVKTSQSAVELSYHISNRLKFVLIMILIITIVIVGRLAYVQVYDKSLADAAFQQRFTVVDLPAKRGEILDRENNVLAKSVQSFDIVVDETKIGPYELTQGNNKVTVTVDDTAQELADILKLDKNTVMKQLTGNKTKKYSVIAKGVSPEIRNTIVEKNIPGIGSQETSRRDYPYGQVGGSIVGYLGSEDDPQTGIEYSQNQHLSGQNGQRSYEQGADGIRIPNSTVSETLPKDGQNVKLTIDSDIQWAAQQEIAAQVKKREAQWGKIVVVEAKTGKIMAMAESSTPDPNNPGATKPDDAQARSITTAFEPGSTEKVITAAAALNEGKTTPLAHYQVPYAYKIDGQTFTDSFDHSTEKRTFAGIIGESMNTGTVMVGKELTRQQRYDYLKRFGIGEKTGVELPGENAGILAPWESWDGRQRYAVLFGQGVSQSALQTAMAFQTIANNGVRLQPQIVESYIDSEGKEHKSEEPKSERVVTEKTAKEVQNIIESVVTVGGAPQAQLDGYRTGGKTGTAEAPADDEVGFNGVTASFVGMAPMEDPRYVVGVTIQRPKGKVYGVTAAPSFKKIMTQTLTKYRVPLSTTDPVRLPQTYK